MSPGQQTVMIMAGGTGGHIFPGLAVADVLRSRGVNVRWLGAAGGMECTRVPEQGYEIDQLNISGVRGKGVSGWIALPFRLLRAVVEAGSSMNASHPACVVSFGGYVAGPGGIAAWLRGIPLVVHEQNRIPGLTNRILSRLAKRVLQAFPGSFSSRQAAQTCGNPVRRSLLEVPAPDVRFFQRSGKPRLLITGGSQGAASLNRVVPEALGLLPSGLRPLVCHQCGKTGAAELRGRYQSAGIDAEVHEFIADMAAAYAWADLIICRSGALTVSELAAVGLGAILVPYPHAVDDHQSRNAAFLQEAGAAKVMPESALTASNLAAQLVSMLGDRAALLIMARSAHAVGVKDSAEQVVAACAPWVVT